MARPTKLTADVQERICEAIRQGNYLEVASAYGGVTYRTVRNWMLRGEQDGEGVFFTFLQAIEKAQAEGEAALVGIIRDEAPNTWQAAAWMLERKFPDRWGRRERVDISVLRREVESIREQYGLTDEEAQEAVTEAEAWLKQRR